MRPLRRPFAVLALTLAAPLGAAAQDWSSLVIGTPGQGAETAFADSFHAATALTVLGAPTAQMIRDVSADAILAALDAQRGKPQVILYYAGPLGTAPDGSAQLLGKGGQTLPELGLQTILAGLAAGGTTTAVILIEDCAGGTGQAGKVTLPSLPTGLAVHLVATAGPTGTCADPTARLTTAMTNRAGTGPSMQDLTAGFWTGAAIDAPVQFAVAALGGPSPLATDIGIVDVDAPVVSVVASNIIDVAEPVAQVRPQGTVTTATQTVQDLSVVDDNVAIFVAPAASQLAALPLTEGLPQPSIIIGIIEGSEASFATVDDTPLDVSSNEIAFDNLDARRTLRAQDEELFKTLVASGAFDPPTQPKALETALQTELLRMKCYASTVDGIWGNGSKASVQRYFDEIDGVEPETLEPTIGLFRQVILQDEIECPPPPAPVAQAAPAPRATGSTGTRTTTQAAPRAAAPAPRAAAPAPAPAPAPSGGLSGANLGGVFR